MLIQRAMFTCSNKKRGFSLIEVMVSLTLLTMVTVVGMSVLHSTRTLVDTSRRKTIANQLAQSGLVRGRQYIKSIVQGTGCESRASGIDIPNGRSVRVGNLIYNNQIEYQFARLVDKPTEVVNGVTGIWDFEEYPWPTISNPEYVSTCDPATLGPEDEPCAPATIPDPAAFGATQYIKVISKVRVEFSDADAAEVEGTETYLVDEYSIYQYVGK